MELNWTTFLLEIINFLVLIWLLKHFLYKPVYSAIEKRRQAIEEDLASAREKNQQAAELLQQQRQQQDQWQQQQQQAKQALQQAIDAEREKKLAALEADLAAASERRQAVAEHQQQAHAQLLERQAVALSHRFASQLLARFSGPQLEQLIIDTALDDLDHLDTAQADTLRAGLANTSQVRVTSVHPLTENTRQRLQQILQAISGQSSLAITYELDPQLVCGLSLSVEGFEIQANIARELTFFAGDNHRA